MSEGSFSWDQDQWNTVRQAVHDQALRARVAASFLPLFGPLASSDQTVPTNRLEDSQSLAVNDYDVLRLATVSVNLRLRNAQVSDPDLSSALIMFRRAASVLARVEDAIIFTGQSAADAGPNGGLGQTNVEFRVSGGGAYKGLMGYDANTVTGIDAASGPSIFGVVVRAVTKLEDAGYYGPYALVLGDDLFEAVNKPIAASMVLPRDSIMPYLNGPLLRSSTIDPKQGVLVSTLSDPVEIVVGSDIAVRYLQTTDDAKHVFRVSQRFVLRVKEPKAIALLKTAQGTPGVR